MIPEVEKQGIAKFIDVFCEQGYFDIDQSKRILKAGKSAGLKLRVHADEFYNFGASLMAGEMGARELANVAYGAAQSCRLE